MATIVSAGGGSGDATGENVTSAHLGANFLFNRERLNECTGDGGFDETAQSLGIHHVRYPGGRITERQFDPSNPENTLQATDLIDGSAISNSQQHALTPLGGFLDEAAALGWQVTLVLPTARYVPALGNASALAAVEAEIRGFVRDVMEGPNAGLVEAFEIGNEWYAIGLTASEYGAIANEMAVWVAEEIAAAASAHPPQVALQLGQKAARTDETSDILAQMSPGALAALDAVIVHNYRPFPWDDADVTAGKFAHVAVAEAAAGRPLDVLVTEWNVGNASPADGLMQGAGMLEMFDQMLRLGMDRAHVWPVLENNTTRLAADVTVPGEAAELMIGGEIYRQMVQSLPGQQALDVATRLDVDADATVDFLLHAYGGAGGGLVVFISSLEQVAREVSLDLSLLAPHFAQPGHLWLTTTGVVEGVDPTSPHAMPVTGAVSLSYLRDGAATTPLTVTLDPYEIARLEFSGPGANVLALADTSEVDDFRLTAQPEVIVLGNDGARDLVRDFDLAFDRVDVSALGVASFSDLRISELRRSDGSVNWVEIADADGRAELFVRYADGTPLEAGRLDAGYFIFADQPLVLPEGLRVTDTAAFDSLRGTAEAEVFRLANDGVRDLLRDFDLARDVIDVSGWGVSAFDQLTLEVQFRRDGSANWLNVIDTEGQAEVALRYADGAPLEVASLTDAHFVFATEGQPGPAPLIREDTAGTNDFRGTAGAEVYTMQDDDALDLIRSFERGIDRIDLTAFGVSSFADLDLVEQYRKDGSINWVQIFDADGDREIVLRLAGEATRADLLTADDFILAG